MNVDEIKELAFKVEESWLNSKDIDKIAIALRELAAIKELANKDHLAADVVSAALVKDKRILEDEKQNLDAAREALSEYIMRYDAC
jgi:hypothetical protein